MEQEIFAIPFEYKGAEFAAEVRTVMPEGPKNADYEIWMNGKYVFTIIPYEDECNELCWKSKEPGVDLEFVNVIAEAVEGHHL